MVEKIRALIKERKKELKKRENKTNVFYLRCNICGRDYSNSCELSCRGNRAARQRMIELYALASEIGGIVCGTENLSEYYLGYFTLHGDSASDIEPIHGYSRPRVEF